MRNLSFCLVVAAFAVVGGCSEERRTQGGGLPDLAGGGVFDLASTSGCSDAAKLVYLVDQNNDFLSFKPDTAKFTKVGSLSCPAQFGATPFSMGVDRTPTAWVLYNSGELFKVSTTDASCTATSFQVGQQGFQQFGMGFASDVSGSDAETLYIAGGDLASGMLATAKFGTLSFPGLAVAQKGSVSGQPELTGTGDGKLWGFFPSETSPKVSEIDKATGADGTVYPLAPLKGSPSAWAFAFWGGDFYVFLQRSTDLSTNVYRVKGSDGSVSTVTLQTGRTIVGAGVSTCAPLMVL